MKACQALKVLIGLSLSAWLSAAPAFAQATKAAPQPAPKTQTAPKPYEPEVGQAGKDVVWVPTSQALVDKMLEMAKVTPQDYVIDLGSGDGRTVITAAKRGSRALGIEYNPDMVELSKRNAEKEGVTDKATFMKADLFESDFSKAQVITMFLLPSINMKLRPKLLDLKPGTRIVSNSFTMEDWSPDESQTIEEDCSNWCTAHLWIVPAKIDGAWTLPQGQLTIKQEFQKFSGTLGSSPIVDGRIKGEDVTFMVGNVSYTGRVEGDTIKGTTGASTNGNGNGGGTAWTATRAK